MFVIVGEIRQAMLFDIGAVMEPAVYVHGRIIGLLSIHKNRCIYFGTVFRKVGCGTSCVWFVAHPQKHMHTFWNGDPKSQMWNKLCMYMAVLLVC